MLPVIIGIPPQQLIPDPLEVDYGGGWILNYNYNGNLGSKKAYYNREFIWMVFYIDFISTHYIFPTPISISNR